MMAKIRFRRSTQQAPPATELKANTSTTSHPISVVSITATANIHSNNDGQHHSIDDNNKSIVVIESLTKQQQQQQAQQPMIKSDRKKTSRSFRILSLSKHKKQKQQPSTTTTTTSNEPPTNEALSPSSLPTTSVNTTPATNTTTTSSGSRFFAGRSKFKRSSISIANNGIATAPPTTTTTSSTTTSSLRGDISSLPVSNHNGKKNATSAFNSTSNYASNKTVISTQMPPYEIEITEIDGTPYMECPLCVLVVSYTSTPDLKSCGHRTCMDCMQRYLKTEINHSRLNITCPICSEPLLQNVIREILNDDKFYFKYESFMLRKVLAAEPDARWCPAPDCGYAVLANGCASCPRLLCARPGCDTAFCYHCKQEWHPNQTCSAASIQRNMRAGLILNVFTVGDLNEESTQPGGARGGQAGNRKLSKSSQHNATLRPEDIKECPVCSSRIIKMNDGSCNHMTCSICETEFCWLCMKEISDFHYFSPSGCTFWGKKPWSRKKKLLWRLGMLVGAPICIVFIAGIAVPAIVIGIPVWAARKLHTRLEKRQFSRYRKNAIITGGVLLSFVVSPIISAMALAVGIPILLGYVYGVVPLSLCRSSGGCLSANASVENLNEQFRSPLSHRSNMDAQATDVVSISTAASHKMGNPSIGETSLYMSNISLETNSIGHVTTVERDDRESASNAGLAGSILSQNVDDGNSTRALAGSIISKESNGFTLIPAEIHNHQENSNQSSLPSAATTTTTTTTTSIAAGANRAKDSPDCDEQSSSGAEVDRVAMVVGAT